MTLHDNMFWRWKSRIIDFSKFQTEEEQEKVTIVFNNLPLPIPTDFEPIGWCNGWHSCEYNDALKYAFDLDLVEEVFNINISIAGLNYGNVYVDKKTYDDLIRLKLLPTEGAEK